MQKKVYVTGITGTVAKYVKRYFESQHYTVIDTHFRVHDESDVFNVETFLHEHKPNMIIHLALGPIDYASMLAKWAYLNHAQFMYISSVSVFEDNVGGPYTHDTMVTVSNPYGLYKYECEKAVQIVNKDAYVIRIGWQIDPNGDTNSNNMFKFIHEQQREGKIKVSSRFYPSTSWLPDTAKAIFDIMTLKPDLYLVNSNHHLSLFEIIKNINQQFGLQLDVIDDHTFSRNDVMMDTRVSIKSLFPNHTHP